MDIDLDFGDRAVALALLQHTPATINRAGEIIKHPSGVYVTDVPIDPVTGWCSLDYITAEKLGYFKIDFLNVGLYQQIRDPAHLEKLMNTEPMWELLQHREIVQQLVHINNHFDLMQSMPEPIDSILKLAMMQAIIRPGKRHLKGLPWDEVAKTVWDRDNAEGYTFRHSHALAYSMLVIVNLNLLCEKFV